MKYLFLAFLIFATSPAIAYNGLLERADEQYSKRDYTPDGISSASDAAYNYNRVAKNLLSNLEAYYATARELRANHFVGMASDKKKERIFFEGFTAGERAMITLKNTYGPNPFSSLNERGKKIYAELIAFHAFNIMEWVRSNSYGNTSEWKKVEARLQQSIQVGADHVTDYSPRQALALKSIYDGAYAAALPHLEVAFNGTKYKKISRNGFINYYYAMALSQTGNRARAISILKDFLNEHPTDMSVDFVPENFYYQKLSRALLKSWGVEPSRMAFVPGEYVVKLKNISTQSLTELSKTLGVEIKERISSKLLLVKEKSINKLHSNALVEIVEPNYMYYASEVNDPLFNTCWGMQNTGQLDPKGGIKGVAGVDVHALDAWKISNGSKNVVVAVIDTGVDFNHPDLMDARWINEAEANGLPGVDDDHNGFIDDINGFDFIANTGKQIDDNKHGTHVAGVIAAQGNNGFGIAGIAWNTKIMALKFLDSNGGGSLAEAIKAIQYATKMKAQISNNSWGGGAFSAILKETIEDAGKAGSLFVAAAGNSGENSDEIPEYPGAYSAENIVAVAAVDNRGRMSNFSNYGIKSIDIAAPGQNIMSTIPGGEYISLSGTSMATPFVAGVAALVLAQNPNFKQVELKERLLSTTSQLVSLKGKVGSGGMVNAFNAITGKTTEPDPNDPERWQTSAYHFESQTPIPNDTDYVFEIKNPGAKKITVHFSKFNFEKGYDRLFFFDSFGNRLGAWTDIRDSGWSPIADGDTIQLRFVTDRTEISAGFSLDKMGFQ